MASGGYDGHASKRQRTDAEGYGVQSGKRDNFEDPHKPSPSPVVHVRGLRDSLCDKDLIDAVQQFGPVSNVMVMSKKRQALIEFEDMSGAMNLVDYAQNSPVYVAGRQAHFNYSMSQKIQRPNGEENPNNVLLFTVWNPKYPITVDVMHTICSQSGPVNRIVIFKKNGVQAMVEFDSIEAAQRAKQSLNGADIYSGCCTLRIEYAKPTRLSVHQNTSESWDYTDPNLGKEPPAQKTQPLLAEPRYGTAPMPFGSPDQHQHQPRRGPPPPSASPMSVDYGQPEPYDGYNRPPPPERYAPPPQQNDRYNQDHYQSGPPPPQRFNQYGPPHPNHDPYAQDNGQQGPPGMYQQGCVIMLYGLNHEKMNCQKLFNIFCLYGNVVRVKFLKSKEGVAMMQMGDNTSCDRALKNLHNVFIFGSKMQLGFSKQAFLQDVPHPHDLPDGSPSFIDFMGNRNNRFTNPEAAAKNRIQAPSKVLYYFNAPPTVSEEELNQLFEDAGAKPPVKSKQFASKNDKSSTGLVEWESKGEAIEGLALVNHAQLPNPNGKHPFVFKLCFSSTPIMPPGYN